MAEKGYSEHLMTYNEKELVDFVMKHVDPWEQHRRTNYDELWDEYERMYRMVWAEEDKQRQSERSRIVTPAIQQAVDSMVSEIGEAILNRNEFFEIDDEEQTNKPQDVTILRKKMRANFKKDKLRKSLLDVVQLGQMYGTGIGEIVISKVKDQSPAAKQMTPDVAAVGTVSKDRLSVKVHPVHPRNFIPDPLETDVDVSLGYAIKEKVAVHKIVEAMVNGEYKPYNLTDCSNDSEIEPDSIAVPYRNGAVVVYRWYGKVPKEYLENLDKDKEVENDALDEAIEALGNDEYEDYSDMVEAIVHIAEGSHLLKAVKNPYMMQDRSCLLYRPKTVPGRVWGIGTIESGYSMQKSIDMQVRSHLDSIALTAAPMIGMDATRLPRNFKFIVAPGRTVLSQGNPDEIFKPLKLGEPSDVNLKTAQFFQQALQQATGTIDSSGMPQQVNNQTDAGAMAMALSGIIKRHKQALLNFQEEFLIPFIQRAAWRFMQFDPENFPVQDWNFIPSSNLGIMAREYEQQQLISLMQTLGPESPIVPLLLKSIVEKSSIANREELMLKLEEMSKPNPEAQKAAMEQQQMQIQTMQAQLQELQAKAEKYSAEAEKAKAEAQAVPIEAQAKLAGALATNLDDNNEAADFQRRLEITDRALKEKELNLKEQDTISNERIAQMQVGSKLHEVKQRSHDMDQKAHVERMKIERDKEGNLTVTKSKGD